MADTLGRNARLLAAEGKPPSVHSISPHLHTAGPASSSVVTTKVGKDSQLTRTLTWPKAVGLFGYSCLFTPMIPIFFAGEEFDATYRPIPWLSAHLFGGQDLGKGAGSMEPCSTGMS